MTPKDVLPVLERRSEDGLTGGVEESEADAGGHSVNLRLSCDQAPEDRQRRNQNDGKGVEMVATEFV